MKCAQNRHADWHVTHLRLCLKPKHTACSTQNSRVHHISFINCTQNWQERKWQKQIGVHIFGKCCKWLEFYSVTAASILFFHILIFNWNSHFHFAHVYVRWDTFHWPETGSLNCATGHVPPPYSTLLEIGYCLSLSLPPQLLFLIAHLFSTDLSVLSLCQTHFKWKYMS